MNYSIEHKDDIVIFTVKQSSIDSEDAADMKAEMLILCQPNINALIIDMTRVERIDSSGLGALLLAHRQLKDNDIPVILVGVGGIVLTLMQISRIHSLFGYFDTVDEALSEIV
ncbi:MAG: STAS domain-containing protein [Candidatus Kapaibacterium sp.]